MCGIIGFSSDKVDEHDLFVLERVLIESKIRGKHASGIAWLDDDNKIQSIVRPVPMDEMLKEFDISSVINMTGRCRMIAHTRYSTSDIRYNQPIVGNSIAIAHNGVITQSSPDTWENTYGIKCETSNDSELLLRALENNIDIDIFDRASIAAVILDSKNGLVWEYRNGLRPMWTGNIGYGTVYASTYDILQRSGVNNIRKVEVENDKQVRCMRDVSIKEQRKVVL